MKLQYMHNTRYNTLQWVTESTKEFTSKCLCITVG